MVELSLPAGHNPDSCSDSVAVALCALKRDFQPVVAVGAVIHPDFRRSTESSHHDVEFEADWERVLSVNVMGTAFCAKYAAEAMIRAGGGSIVNVTSISGLIAQERSVPYNTSKAALQGLNRCLAMDLARQKIRVNAIAPGCVDTPQLRRDAGIAGMSYEQVLALEGPLHLLNRFARAEEIANAILFLASDEASFITGTCLMVDGGYTAK